MGNLERVRQQLNSIIEEAAVDLEATEIALATAVEQQTTAAVASALKDQRDWVIGLIDEQLDQFNLAGINPIALQTLKRRIQSGGY